MSRRKSVAPSSRVDDEIAAFLKSGIQKDAARYQDGAFRKPRGAVKCTMKSAVLITLVTLLLVVASVLYGVFVGNDTQETFFKLIERKYGIVVPRQKTPICLESTSVGIKPLTLKQFDEENVKWFMFPGRYNISEAVKVCRTHPKVRGWLANVFSPELDKALTNFVNESKTELFAGDEKLPYGMKELIWTGGYIELEVNEGAYIQWHGTKGRNNIKILDWYKNFCDRPISKVWEKVRKLIEIWRKQPRGVPIIQIVKDYKRGGCWQLFDNLMHDWATLELHLVCESGETEFSYRQASVTNPQTKEVRTGIFYGKLRGDPPNRLADRIGIFSGRGPFSDAVERCETLEPGGAVIAPAGVAEDFDINKLVEHHSMTIFGTDSGDPDRKTLIWTGYYFNLSSKYPKTLRRWDDPSGVLDLPPPQEIKEYAFQKYEKFKYENFCGPEHLYMTMIEDAIEEREKKKDNCIKNYMMHLVKDYRPGQATQGCWHLYDGDYIEKHKIELYLMCKLPGKASETAAIRKETSVIFNYFPDSKEP